MQYRTDEMQPFLHGSAAHADWRQALASVAAQIEGQLSKEEHNGSESQPTLGFVYVTDHYAAESRDIVDELGRRWPGVAWVGSVGVGVSAGGVEYFDEPALSIMLAALPIDRFRVFSGAAPLPAGFAAHAALIHADPSTPDVDELLHDMSARTSSGYLFGGLASSRADSFTVADGVWQGGLSGVAFTSDVAMLSRMTQGCQPVGPVRHVTEAERNVVLTLDHLPALDMLLQDIEADLTRPHDALQRLRQTLVGMSDPSDAALARPGQFGVNTRVRHIVGIDPAQRAVAIADEINPGMQLTFCSRHTEAAALDLTRICAEIREELESDESQASPKRIAGAIFVSCAGRGGPHFGAPSAELQIVRRALGDVPLAGFFAGGEIAHKHLYGYTAVLTVFIA
jgi:small ligand-binding sensory domain FIST